ncbi:MAG: GSCFA domain-containing protein [Cyclobacteriaceae bacterium]|nr:GSCFA domain-containing protein [Cyclobacteriaceae bacterium]
MFRTELHIAPSPQKISLKDPIFLIGSCFSTNIGSLLERYKFNSLANPFGTIFNPISINKLLITALNKSYLSENGYGKNQDIHFHYDLHSQFSSLQKEALVEKGNHTLEVANHHLKTTKWLIITWGSAIIYEHKNIGEVVANCHKVPAKNFNKRLLSTEEIVLDFEKLMTILPDDINILLTVSPVRHIKETIELNSASKSILRIATHTLTEKFNNIQYFPSYELMMDDLRDYRFYKSDMLHPSEEAIQYIWQKFSGTYFDDTSMDFIKEWDSVLKALNHKPFNVHSDEHQKFLKKIISKLNSLSYNINTSEELKYINSQILN